MKIIAKQYFQRLSIIMTLLLFLSITVATTFAATTLNISINPEQNGNSFYQVFVNNDLWLESGQLEGYFKNKWSSTNQTTVKNGAWDQIILTSTSTKINQYDDFGGEYTEQIFSWQTSTTMVQFDTSFKLYDDGQAVSFVQSFPYMTVTGTNLLPAPIPNGCDSSEYHSNPFLTFPSFNIVSNSKYAAKKLGYLTWTNTMSTADYGTAPLSTAALAGINGGPVVLYDNNDNAILVATNDNFGISTQLNTVPSGAAGIATFMSNNQRQDSLFCISSQCYSANGDYGDRDVEGKAFAQSNDPDLIPLTLWFSEQHQDNYVATTTSPPDDTYTISLNNGYIYRNNGTNRLGLGLYYNKKKQDHATAATQKIKNQLLSQGYVFKGIQGYILVYNDTGYVNDDWRLGIAAQILEIPQGFKHETVMVVGDGIHDVVLNKWSKRLTSLYHTARIEGDSDVVTSYLGYWTDNGAYYYGDSWSGATRSDPMNLTCCSLDEMQQTKEKLDAQQIPVKYWQMDDWWYNGNYPDTYWGGVKAVSHWEPPETYYPGGLAGLSKTIQVPLLLYGPYFQPENDWSGEFEFIPQGAAYVLPAPQDSYGFYSALFDFGIDASTNGPNTGMVAYEVDFMSCLAGTPYFRLHVGAKQQWLDGMNLAAKERGLGIQYCMASPMDLMQSLSLSQVTNGRASDDYASGGNWDIGCGSILWSALDLKPSKDNFWTYFEEPMPAEIHPFGPDHNSTELHAITAVLSLGPVGISDRAGYSNATLIKRLCRSDGRLLQPGRPITAIDDQFILRTFSSKTINVWSTEFGPRNVYDKYHIVYAIDMGMTYNLNYSSFTPALNSNFQYIVRNWHHYTNCMINGTMALKSNCIQLVEANSNYLYALAPQAVIYPMHHSFELIQIVDADLNECVLLGELNKYVSVSEHRFDNLIIDGSSLGVDVKGEANENVEISVLVPMKTGNTDWNVYTYNIVIPLTGTYSFNI